MSFILYSSVATYGLYYQIMSLKDNINGDVKKAMRARDKGKTATLRLILSEIKQIEVDERRALNDADVTAVLTRMVKQRRDSIAQYVSGNRPDLAEKEHAEIKIIQAYLPEQLSDAEIDTVIEQVVADTDAESMKDMGRVMSKLKVRLQGRADMGAVSDRVKVKLGGA